MPHAHSVLILGGGNMGAAMAARWRGRVRQLEIIEPDAARRSALIAKGFSCHADIKDTQRADILVLAIKPQQFAASVASIKSATSQNAVSLVLSIMAGVPLAGLSVFGGRVARVMPNLPATIGESMSVLCAPELDATSRQLAERLFAVIGKTAWVEHEEMLHAVTAISGSGPAYVFTLMEAMTRAAIKQGLPAEISELLVKQTVRGAALLADQSSESAASLRAQVTSKGGTTEAALAVMAQKDFADIVEGAVVAAAERSHILAK